MPVNVGLVICEYMVFMLFPLTSRKEVALIVGVVIAPVAAIFTVVPVPVKVDDDGANNLLHVW